MTTTFFMWFVVTVSLLMVGFFFLLIRSVRQREQQTKKLETMALERQATQHTIEELQAKVAAFEDVQPRLIHEPIIISRTITSSQQPRYLSVGGGGRVPQPYHYNACDSVFFALLRITNVPESMNSEAIAWKIYADVTYCDSQGKQLFPSVSGVWVEPDHGTELRAIGYISSDRPSLKPNEKTYLGLTIGYFLDGGQVQYGALTASSPAHRDWLHPETLLSSGVSGSAVNIKVTIRGNGFRTTSYYVLEVNKEERKFFLKAR